jgi:cell division ATPase FtsA
MATNAYTATIADGLNINLESAEKIRDFVNKWFDFRWSSATKLEIVRTAKQAQTMMADPRFAELIAWEA